MIINVTRKIKYIDGVSYRNDVHFNLTNNSSASCNASRSCNASLILVPNAIYTSCLLILLSFDLVVF